MELDLHDGARLEHVALMRRRERRRPARTLFVLSERVHPRPSASIYPLDLTAIEWICTLEYLACTLQIPPLTINNLELHLHDLDRVVSTQVYHCFCLSARLFAMSKTVFSVGMGVQSKMVLALVVSMTF